MLHLLARHRLKFGLAVIFGAVLIALLIIYGGSAFQWALQVSDIVIDWIRDAPLAIFYLATALLPLTGLPVVPFYLASGAAHGLAVSLLGVGIALLINLSISYYAARWLQGPVGRLLARAGWKVPKVPEDQYVRFTILVRLTPGAPLMVQNYILGLTGTPFKTYILVSWCSEMLIATGYIVTGESIYAKSWGFLFAGLGLIVFVVLLTQFLRATFKDKSTPAITKES
ncbi:TVP38/TMEM64 family protein [Rubellicoccus peritrichatus]|uniref:TVP38/TMEM64 family membrane protein n=1 Tax=Rubellicoccus peritrichatus TaxID=3080537 RepID=A0AAQ3L9L9_9BACT|nr:VTT domain-containing protein [Puniceicoccus sp. CR14]WOO39388.1 hypothetical protein RZN69_12255 [Puniceicoccus sp. CR14]